MRSWAYLHQVEYRRVHADGTRVLHYTELADDQGWCTSHRGMSRQDYLVYYTRGCAEDFLARAAAPHGEWLVAVYRLEPERRLVCSIKMRWPVTGTAAQDRVCMRLARR